MKGKKAMERTRILSTAKKSMEKTRILSTAKKSIKKTKETKKAIILSPSKAQISTTPDTSSGQHGCRGKKNQTTGCNFCKRDFLSPDNLSKHLLHCYHKLVLKRRKGDVRKTEYEEFSDVDDGKVSWLAGGHPELLAWIYSKKAVEYLNDLLDNKKKDYKLVRPGPFAAAGIGRGPMVHFNFKAKAKNSEMETFFCQLRAPESVMVVDLCLSLGLSCMQPPWGSAQFYGCRYCRYDVHHPNVEARACAKLIRGIEEEDTDWLYGPRKEIYGTPTHTDSEFESESDYENWF